MDRQAVGCGKSGWAGSEERCGGPAVWTGGQTKMLAVELAKLGRGGGKRAGGPAGGWEGVYSGAGGRVGRRLVGGLVGEWVVVRVVT